MYKKDESKFKRYTEEEKREIGERIRKTIEERKKTHPEEFEHKLPKWDQPGYIKTEAELAAEKRWKEEEILIEKYGELFPDSPVKDWYNTVHLGPWDFPDKMRACIEKGIPMEELYPDEYDYFFDYEGEYGYIGPTHP